jgi:hypothetical protein
VFFLHGVLKKSRSNMFIVYRVVWFLRGVNLRMVLCNGDQIFLYGAGIDGGFVFLRENTLPLNPHTSVPVPVPISSSFDVLGRNQIRALKCGRMVLFVSRH